jgi:putative oxidoreductase
VIIAYLVGLAQFGGGLAILTRIFFRCGAICIAIVMLGAIVMVHLPNGFDVSKGGLEYAFTQLLIALALLLAGPVSLFARSGVAGAATKAVVGENDFPFSALVCRSTKATG